MKNLYWEGFFKIISVQYNIYSTIQYISTNYSIYYSCAVRKSVSEQTLGGPIFVQFDEKKLNNWCTVFSDKMQLECFFYQGFLSRTLTTHRTEREGRGPFFYSTLPFRPAHEHSYGSLQLCMWDVYHTFLIATLVYTRLLLDETYHLIELPFDWLMMKLVFACLLDDLILGFCYSNLDIGNWWTRNRIDYHSCITSEPTNQVC